MLKRSQLVVAFFLFLNFISLFLAPPPVQAGFFEDAVHFLGLDSLFGISSMDAQPDTTSVSPTQSGCFRLPSSECPNSLPILCDTGSAGGKWCCSSSEEIAKSGLTCSTVFPTSTPIPPVGTCKKKDTSTDCSGDLPFFCNRGVMAWLFGTNQCCTSREVAESLGYSCSGSGSYTAPTPTPTIVSAPIPPTIGPGISSTPQVPTTTIGPGISTPQSPTVTIGPGISSTPQVPTVTIDPQTVIIISTITPAVAAPPPTECNFGDWKGVCDSPSSYHYITCDNNGHWSTGQQIGSCGSGQFCSHPADTTGQAGSSPASSLCSSSLTATPTLKPSATPTPAPVVGECKRSFFSVFGFCNEAYPYLCDKGIFSSQCCTSQEAGTSRGLTCSGSITISTPTATPTVTLIPTSTPATPAPIRVPVPLTPTPPSTPLAPVSLTPTPTTTSQPCASSGRCKASGQSCCPGTVAVRDNDCSSGQMCVIGPTPTAQACAGSGQCKASGQSCCEGLTAIRDDDCATQTMCISQLTPITPTPEPVVGECEATFLSLFGVCNSAHPYRCDRGFLHVGQCCTSAEAASSRGYSCNSGSATPTPTPTVTLTPTPTLPDGPILPVIRILTPTPTTLVPCTGNHQCKASGSDCCSGTIAVRDNDCSSGQMCVAEPTPTLPDGPILPVIRILTPTPTTSVPCTGNNQCKASGSDCCSGTIAVRDNDCSSGQMCTYSGCILTDGSGVTGRYTSGSLIAYFAQGADQTSCFYGTIGTCGKEVSLGVGSFPNGKYASQSSCETSLQAIGCILTDSSATRRYAVGNQTYYYSLNSSGVCQSNKYGKCGEDVPTGESQLNADQFVTQTSCQLATSSMSLTPTPVATVKPGVSVPTPTPTQVVVNCRDAGGGKGFCDNSCGSGYQKVNGVVTECDADLGPGTGTQVCCSPSAAGGCQWCENPATASQACSGNGGSRDSSRDGNCESPKVCYSCSSGGSSCEFKQAWRCVDATGAFSNNAITSCDAGSPCSSGKIGSKEGSCYKDCEEDDGGGGGGGRGGGDTPQVTCGSVSVEAFSRSIALGDTVNLAVTHFPDATYTNRLVNDIYEKNIGVLFKIYDNDNLAQWIVGKKNVTAGADGEVKITSRNSILSLSFDYLPQSLGEHNLIISGRTGEYAPNVAPQEELYCSSSSVVINVYANIDNWVQYYLDGNHQLKADFNGDSKVNLTDYLSWWLSEGGAD